MHSNRSDTIRNVSYTAADHLYLYAAAYKFQLKWTEALPKPSACKRVSKLYLFLCYTQIMFRERLDMKQKALVLKKRCILAVRESTIQVFLIFYTVHQTTSPISTFEDILTSPWLYWKWQVMYHVVKWALKKISFQLLPVHCSAPWLSTPTSTLTIGCYRGAEPNIYRHQK